MATQTHSRVHRIHTIPESASTANGSFLTKIAGSHLIPLCVIKCVSIQNITSRIAYERPEDPLQFMLDEIEKVRQGQKLDTLK